jgi:SAM-dependent methyltransferase
LETRLFNLLGKNEALQTLVTDKLRNNDSWYSHYLTVKGVFEYWLSASFLLIDDIVDVDVLDLGGGYAQLSLILLEKGARSVTIIDPSLDQNFYSEYFAEIPNLKYFSGTIEQFYEKNSWKSEDLRNCNLRNVRSDIQNTKAKQHFFGAVLACSVTEHILNLAECLHSVWESLKPNGSLFMAHDNYYHPSGAHDNFILRFDNQQNCSYQGPRCWELEAKCRESLGFREKLKTTAPWGWDEKIEKRLTPDNCPDCPFFKRTNPWAHLLFQDEFNQIFPQIFFSSGRTSSGLNKITPYMLRQFLIESNFKIEIWHRNFAKNEPPVELLQEPYCLSEIDLRTLNIVTRARKVVGETDTI